MISKDGLKVTGKIGFLCMAVLMVFIIKPTYTWASIDKALAQLPVEISAFAPSKLIFLIDSSEAIKGQRTPFFNRVK